ncbi:hypothetical protein, partial [Staphylococcus aureus]|uniref:hypothetical protein n=1 Tax=Staphylococcus aureus TaxID=1280 RepID=UPI001F4248E1
TLPNQQNRHTHIDSIIYRPLLLPFHTTQITPKKSGANNILEINSSSNPNISFLKNQEFIWPAMAIAINTATIILCLKGYI